MRVVFWMISWMMVIIMMKLLPRLGLQVQQGRRTRLMAITGPRVGECGRNNNEPYTSSYVSTFLSHCIRPYLYDLTYHIWLIDRQ